MSNWEKRQQELDEINEMAKELYTKRGIDPDERMPFFDGEDGLTLMSLRLDYLNKPEEDLEEEAPINTSLYEDEDEDEN